MGWMLLVHTLLLTATGYSLTLLMASLFRRLIRMKPIWTLVLSLAAVILASSAFSVIETWSVATFLKPELKPDGRRISRRDPAQLRAARRLVGALLRDQLFPAARGRRSDQRERLESQASTAQLAMLRYQLNPHFLFNTLNSISTLVLLKQTERANAMLARLSSFLRYTLANEPTAKVTLAQEVETLKLYLEIEKMRFEDRLRPHFRIESETIGARLPSLLLQPLIENAIKYAVTPSENGADIWITADPRGAGGAGSRSPTMATARARNSRPAHRPASAWRTFGTGCRRPMAAHIVSRPERTSAGASALSSKFPTKPETEA